ncbi:universal stress protein [Dictyobacter formicarum]|uniref:Universal stress protein UspA n=1 Tax=Dictyobacter formicarum TaxID=2778368 RepID=A0ABQ3VC78_9CHLR|nr:universal stress protein [Dictyobacter formicarum]GHO83732.1 universal stress protein UspA [Dictyobacter formicarum]
MLQHILVPLDGSACAEQALPVAARIARANGATITMTRILTRTQEYPYTLVGGSGISMERCYDEEAHEAEDYLEKMVYSETLRDIALQTELFVGLPHQILPALARMKHIDLIVMCSRATTGFKRLVLGSLAQNLIRHSAVPAFILRQGCTDIAAFNTTETQQFSILVALDGSDQTENVLLPAAQLSAALSTPNAGKLHLLHIVKPRHAGNRQPPLLTNRINQHRIEEAKLYLNKLKTNLQQQLSGKIAVEITSSVVVDINVPETIIQTAEQGLATPGSSNAGCNAIAVVTHGNHGLSYWFGDHVTEHMLGKTRLPILVIRLQEQPATTKSR